MTVKQIWKQLARRCRVIEKVWKTRNVTNCAAEPEWSDYENIIYLQAELYWKYSAGHRFGNSWSNV